MILSLHKQLVLFLINLLIVSGLSAQINAGDDVSVCFGEQVTLRAEVELPVNYVGIAFDSSDVVYNKVLPICFNFRFFEEIYNQFVIAPNGWISFDISRAGTYDDWHVKPIPNTVPAVPKNAILAPWQDWVPYTTLGSFVGYACIGEAPHRKLIVNWFNVPLNPYTFNWRGTFQIILNEYDSTIDVHITKKDSTFWQDNMATLGVHSMDGLRGYAPQNRNGTSWKTERESWRFTRTQSYANRYVFYKIIHHPEIIGEISAVTWYEGSYTPENQLSVGNTLTLTPGKTTDYIAVVIVNEAIPFMDTVRVTVNPIPVVHAGNGLVPDTTILQGTTATLYAVADNGTGEYEYSWEPFDLVQYPDERVTETVNLFFPQIFQVQVTDEAGCVSEPDEMMVAIENGPLVANLTVDHPVVCSGDTVMLSVEAFGGEVTQPYSYHWWFDPPYGATPPDEPVIEFIPLISTMCYVEVTDANLTSTVDSTYIKVPEIHPSITGASFSCEQQTGVVYSTPATGNLFNWSVIGLTPENTYFNGNSFTVDWGKGAGSGYIQVVEITPDQYHCSDTSLFPVTLHPKPAPEITSDWDTVCQGHQGAVYTTLDNAGNTYRWSLTTGNGMFSDSTGAEVVIDWYRSGEAWLQVEEKTEFGCVDRNLITITIHPIPTPIIAGPEVICEQDSSSYFTVLDAGNSYEWELIKPSPGIVLAGTDTNEIRIFWDNPGTALLAVKETIRTTLCAATSDTFEVIIHPKPELAAISESYSLCLGDSTLIELTGGDLYYWQPYQDLTWINDSSWLARPPELIHYFITGTDTITGCSDTLSFDIEIKPLPEIELGEDRYLAPGKTIYLDPGDGFDEYWWNTGSQDQKLAVDAAGFYKVMVVLRGCTTEDSLWIRMPGYLVPFPNAFTPNGDGRNDTFGMVGSVEEVTQYHLQVFNRWGLLLFETTNPSEGWDGSYQGAPCDAGAYLWILSMEEKSAQQTITKQGYINLLR